MIDLNNLSARRGFFDVHTPLEVRHLLLLTPKEFKAQQNEIISCCEEIREEVYTALGRPNKTNLKVKFKARVFHHNKADLVRLYFALGERIQQMQNLTALYRAEQRKLRGTE